MHLSRPLYLLLPLGLLLGTNGAAATPSTSAELTVQGVIKPDACTLSVSGNGTLDFGTISGDELSNDGYTYLEPIGIEGTITCSNLTLVELYFSDEAMPQTEIRDSFNLVSKDRPDHQLGTYQIVLPTARENDLRVRFRRRSTGQLVTTAWAGELMEPDVPVSNLKFNLVMSPSLPPSSEFDPTVDTAIAGRMAIELRYR